MRFGVSPVFRAHVGARPHGGVAREQRTGIEGIAQEACAKPRQCRLAAPRGAAPDGGDVGNFQLFAQKRQGQGGQISVHGGGFHHPAAQGIGQHHAAIAHRFHQPGNAQRAIAAKFQRIAEIRIDAAENRRHPLQPRQGFEKDFGIAHHQIIAFDQGQAQIMGEIDMLEIGFVIGTGRQQHGAVAARGGQLKNIFAIGVKEGGQPRDLQFAEGSAKLWPTTSRFSSA